MVVAVVIPALNEAATLVAVLRSLPAGVRVVVADNGSTDATADLALRCGAEVVAVPRRGYGSAVLAGIARLAPRPPDVLVVLDADLSDSPHLLSRLVEPIAAGRADLVCADRSRTAERGALTLPQRFGNGLAVRLIHRVSGRRFQDLGPFRAIRWTSLQRLALEDPTWGFNVEMNLKAVRHGLRIEEVPLPYGQRRGGRSKISGSIVGSARAGYRILAAVQRYR